MLRDIPVREMDVASPLGKPDMLPIEPPGRLERPLTYYKYVVLPLYYGGNMVGVQGFEPRKP